MRALIHYYLSDYILSYRYVPPLTIYLLAIIINYTYKPNPVLSSTAVTAVYLFLLMAWFTFSFFHLENQTQQQLTILHAKSKRKVFLSQFLTMGLCVLVLSGFAIAYPALLGMFGDHVSFLTLIIGFLSHVCLGVLSVALTALFTRHVVKNSGMGWLGTILVLLTTIAGAGLHDALPNTAQWLTWLLPPVPYLLSVMGGSHAGPVFPVIGFVYVWLLGYAVLLIILFFVMQHSSSSQ